jgi:uncharacterized cupin superfamily protein
MTTPAAMQSSINPEDFEPFPIADVTAGEPNGQVHWLRKTGADGQVLAAGIFTAMPSSYPYQFPGDETSHVLEGCATVAMEDGTVIELRPGVIASFVKGANSTWEVHEPFRKFFVVSA